jgi:hypothetical protein
VCAREASHARQAVHWEQLQKTADDIGESDAILKQNVPGRTKVPLNDSKKRGSVFVSVQAVGQ